MTGKSLFFFVVAGCFFVVGVSGGADTTESSITDFVTKVADHVGEMVTNFPTSAANVTEGLKIVDHILSFVRYPVLSRFHTWFLSSKIRKAIVTVIIGASAIIFVALLAIVILVILSIFTGAAVLFAVFSPFFTIASGIALVVSSFFY